MTGFNDTFWIDYEWTGPEICSKSYLLTVRVIDHTPILYAYIYVHVKFRIEILVKNVSILANTAHTFFFFLTQTLHILKRQSYKRMVTIHTI